MIVVTPKIVYHVYGLHPSWKIYQPDYLNRFATKEEAQEYRRSIKRAGFTKTSIKKRRNYYRYYFE